MRKIPTLFVRDEDDRSRLTGEVTPGCEWVMAGEGRATRKLDGTACMVKDGVLWKRHTLSGHDAPPPGFLPACEQDPVTRQLPGWITVDFDLPENRWHREAWRTLHEFLGIPLGEPYSVVIYPGTFELIGPKVNGNPEKMDHHYLIAHTTIDTLIPRELVPEPTPDALERFLTEWDIEGIVWHHPDGQRMAKIKGRDFGIRRGFAFPPALPWIVKVEP